MSKKEKIGLDLIDDMPDYAKTKEENEKIDIEKYQLEKKEGGNNEN